jgi:hypothetical protein
MFSAYTTPPIFYENTELSATALRILQDNTLILDGVAERGMNGMRIKNPQTNVGGELHGIWYGAFQKRAGMTTATITLFTQPIFGELLIIRFNDVTVHSASMPSGSNTFTFDITGYALNEIVRVDVFASATGLTTGSTYILTDAYCTPITATTTWTAPATFGAITSANLNTLVTAQKHLADYLTYPSLPLTTQSRFIGGFWSTGAFTQLATWRVIPTPTHTRMRVNVNIISRHNRTTRLDIWINGVLNTSETFGSWEYRRISFDINISSYPTGSPLRVELAEYITLGPTQAKGAFNTKYDIRGISTYNPNYTSPTIGTLATMLESMTFSTLQSRLNTLGSALTAIYAKESSRVGVLNRVQMFGRRPVKDFEQEEYYHKGHVAVRARQGDVLVVSGKNLTIGYGKDVSDWTTIDDMEYKYEQEVSLIDNSSVQTKVYYLSEFPGLYHGEVYFIWGDRLDYAAEYYRY